MAVAHKKIKTTLIEKDKELKRKEEAVKPPPKYNKKLRKKQKK